MISFLAILGGMGFIVAILVLALVAWLHIVQDSGGNPFR